MIRKNNTLLGNYTPAFFHIALNTQEELTESNLLNNPTYIHEYIHFIQDVTTIHGLTTIDVFNEDMRVAIHNIYNQEDMSFDVPIIHVIDGEEKNSYAKYINLYNGDDVPLSCREIIKIEYLNISMDKYSSVSDLCIKIIDNNSTDYDISFGAFAIKESMAYILEQKLSLNWVKSSDFPYNFAFRLTEQIYPEFAKDILNVLALCDISLQFLNSGEVFYNFLIQLKNEKILPQKPEDIYDYFYPLQYNRANLTLEESIVEVYSYTKKKLLSYFNDKTFFKNIRNWIEHTLSMALRKRITDRYFLLKLVRGGVASNNKILKDLHFSLGTPVISNLLGSSICIINEQEIDLKYFIAISHIGSLFESGICKSSCECSLYVICLKQGKLVDENCLKSPWLRCEEKERKCYYTNLWRHWKLQGYMPKL